MYPRGALLHHEAEKLLERKFIQPLISWTILKNAVTIIFRKPIRCLEAFCLLLKSRSLKILGKNLAVYPKGLWLAALIRKLHPDHIHTHWAATTASMAMVACTIADVPWSITAHRWDITENNLLRQKACRARFIRAISRRGANELEDLVTIAGWKAPVIHVGVRLPDLIGPDRRRNDATLRIITAANLVPVKGHRYLIEALRLLTERREVLHLDLAGDGVLRTELEQIVKEYRLESAVTFLGCLPHEQLLANLSAGKWDVMVLPSVVDRSGEKEGIPVSLMEAMSCGIPVISTNTGGIAELVKDCGILVPPMNPEALAMAIEQLAADPKLREELGKAGRRRIEERFNLEKCVADLATLFEQAK